MNAKKSITERELDGNPGKRPMTAAPRVAPGEPSIPEQIAKSDFAMQEWFRITSILRDEGRLSQFDGGQIMAACMSYEVMVKGYEAYGGNVVVPGDRGMVKNPALQIFRDGKDSYERACQSLRVNAGAREVAKAETDADPFDQLD